MNIKKLIAAALSVAVIGGSITVRPQKQLTEHSISASAAQFYNGIAYNVVGSSVSIVSGTTATGSVEIPRTINGMPVTTIDKYAFSECTGITSIKLPDSITTINDFAFDACSDLTTINIPSSVRSFGKYVFRECMALVNIDFAPQISTIPMRTFSDCRALTSFVIPSNITSIDKEAFLGCIKLTSLTIPNSVTSIGDKALYACIELKDLYVPSSVSSFGSYSVGYRYNASTGKNAVMTDFTLHSSAGSAAQSYASSNGIKFSAGSAPDPQPQTEPTTKIPTTQPPTQAPTTEDPEQYRFTASLQIESMPYKTTYYVGESFDPTGLTIKATHVYKTYSKFYYHNVQDNPNLYTISGFSSSYAGSCTVTVNYSAHNSELGETVYASTSFTVNIIPVPTEAPTTEAPTTEAPTEAPTTEAVPETTAVPDTTVVPETSAPTTTAPEPEPPTQAADDRFTASIEIVGTPYKSTYNIGENADFTGLALKVSHIYPTHTDVQSYWEVVADYPSKYSITGFSSEKAGACTVTVTYSTYNSAASEWVTASAQFTVNIIETATQAPSTTVPETTSAPATTAAPTTTVPETSTAPEPTSAAPTQSPTDVPAPIKLGDVNGDNEIDAIDASLVLAEYARKSTGRPLQFDDTKRAAGDVNGDKDVDAVDASMILKYYALKSTGKVPSFT